ncbi:hypothetical protein SAMN05421747_11817 [Parapedobacter composti]|uniref:DUF3052 domain-containing protein n=1 Tax=Parapedobacter composti TaxID=623281 RepID=A0A1I1L0L2_9SPHI|nr:hypothetical protein [Parapedobacter composti]SFC66606.1 hypothetical protein SAMN05421747_11817 [Parapedobacter composti]
MNPLFKKLNFKDHKSILALNHPASFQAELDDMASTAVVFTDVNQAASVPFAIVFVTKQTEIDSIIAQLATKLEADAVLWFCYPKGTSKRYTCDFNRDTGWKSLGQYDLEPVRQVAIDEDWSALRFRYVDNIKRITRRGSMALTDKAKQRTTNKE